MEQNDRPGRDSTQPRRMGLHREGIGPTEDPSQSLCVVHWWRISGLGAGPSRNRYPPDFDPPALRPGHRPLNYIASLARHASVTVVTGTPNSDAIFRQAQPSDRNRMASSRRNT